MTIQETTTAALAAVDGLLRLRAVVARHGEPDQMAWWSQETLHPDAGVFVAGRVFPRTHQWAALELASAALAIHDRGRLNGRSACTLFALPPKFERAAELRLRELKMTSPDPAIALELDIFSRELPRFPEALASIVGNGPSGEPPGSTEASGTLFCLGEVDQAALDAPAIMANVMSSLARAYSRSPRGRLALPYYALNGGHGGK